MAGAERSGAPGRHTTDTAADTDRQPQAGISTHGSATTAEFFRTVAELGIQAARALEHAHAMGVVHRDIKPSNLMVDAAGHLWITDFGLAMTRTETNLTLSGDLLGTLRYMSPEQVQAKHGVLDHRTDVYSLGLTLYELLTLQPAFPGNDRQKLIRQVAEDDPRPPRQVNKAIPRDLETIVLKATAKEPESRYVTAQQLADDLGRFVGDRPIRARRPTLTQKAARWSRRHYWAVSRGIAASFAVLLITALAIFNAHQREAKQRLRAEQNMASALDLLDTVYLQYVDDEYMKAAFANDQAPPAEEISPKTMEFLEAALSFYAQFASANRDEPSVQFQVFKANVRMGECQSRLGMYGEAESAFNSAISLAEKWLSEFPGDAVLQERLARAKAGLADVAARQGNWDQVIRDLSHAIRVDPRNALTYNNRGLAYLSKGDFDKAIDDFDKALRDCDEAINWDPDLDVLHNNRALAYFGKGDYDKAIADCDHAIRLNPQDLVARNNRGTAYQYKGELDKAIADYDHAIRLDPQVFLAYHNRDTVYGDKGELDKAIDDLTKAIQLDPNIAYPYMIRAAARAELGQIEDALMDIAKALEIELGTLRDKSFVAWLLATCEEPRLRRPDRAVEMAKEVVTVAPKRADSWTILGAAEYRAGNPKAALDALQKSSELKYYRVARTQFFAAMAHWQLDEKDEARQSYDQAVEWTERNDPENEELRRFRAEAEQLIERSEKHHGGSEDTEKE